MAWVSGSSGRQRGAAQRREQPGCVPEISGTTAVTRRRRTPAPPAAGAAAAALMPGLAQMPPSNATATPQLHNHTTTQQSAGPHTALRSTSVSAPMGVIILMAALFFSPAALRNTSRPPVAPAAACSAESTAAQAAQRQGHKARAGNTPPLHLSRAHELAD